MVFDAGWKGAGWLSFANACHEAMPHLSIGEKQEIEEEILKYIPEIDLAISLLKTIKLNGEAEPFWTRESIIYQMNRAGYKQWSILEIIGEQRFSPIALSRLNELRRKFPKDRIEKPAHNFPSTDGSPVHKKSCCKMRDSNWLSAIKNYKKTQK